MNAIVKQAPKEELLGYMALIKSAASDPSVDVGKMEKLLDMQERIIKHHAAVAFNEAFAEMQGEMPVITKYGEIKVNGTVRSTYAKFEDINESVKPILQKYGFSVMFKSKTEPNSATVTGIIMHNMGHREETQMLLEADTSGSKNTVQSIGSSISYAKRYILCGLLNITTTDEDDDGQAGGKAIPSCWDGPKMRTHYSTELQRLWGRNDAPGYRQLWDELNSDQKADIWGDFNSRQRSEMKEMLASTKPETTNE
jgi:hypothetical protein